jgi:starch synthase
MSLRVLLCTSECVPFVKTGGLADVAGALPKALADLGHDVRVALPKYSAIDSSKIVSTITGSARTVRLGNRSLRVNIEASDAINGVTTYLVDCPEYFDRDGLYGHSDDAERFALFCRAILEFLRQGDWQPDVIHGNDWQTALVPVYLRTAYADDPRLSRIGTLHTIHNLAYQGVFDRAMLDAIGLDPSLYTVNDLEFYGRVNPLKGAMVFADILNTVSKTYSKEIQTAEYGEKLEGVLSMRKDDLFGVLNGLDYDVWNPAADEFLAAPYSAQDTAPKAKSKAGLQKRLGLPQRPDVPLFGLVSRLASQKGLDILADLLPHMLQLDVQFALLGTGEPYYHDLLSAAAKRFPDRMAAALTFDNALAHQIYGGCDFFLMPSRYEPCGLGQMISLRYGTIPIVRSTGGLADTVEDFDPATGSGNGFTFTDYTPVALFGAISRSLLTMQADKARTRLIRNAMSADFSWRRSAEQYVQLYERASRKRGS